MKTSLRYPHASIIAVAVGCLIASPLCAQDTAEPAETVAPSIEAPPAVSPEAQAVLDRMTAYMQGLTSFSIDGATTSLRNCSTAFCSSVVKPIVAKVILR